MNNTELKTSAIAGAGITIVFLSSHLTKLKHS